MFLLSWLSDLTPTGPIVIVSPNTLHSTLPLPFSSVLIPTPLLSVHNQFTHDVHSISPSQGNTLVSPCAIFFYLASFFNVWGLYTLWTFLNEENNNYVFQNLRDIIANPVTISSEFIPYDKGRQKNLQDEHNYKKL